MKIDNEIRSFGKENKVPITLDDTLSFLLDVINENNSKEILEIGTAIGFGCITMAENTKCNHIDTLEIDEERFNIANVNIKNKGLENKISTHLIDAKEFLTNCPKKYDFIYLDGPKGQYINYLPLLTKLLNPNGVIFADNLNFHGMVTGEIPISKGCRAMIKGLKNYIQEITTNPIYETQIYTEIGDGVSITKLK
ncbi:MAG: class I SAM-dependent methyltransferase [Clostridia bacterium]|nr:class I SAM-dependent methyltransferase [Clostridia bacterium]